MSNRHAPVKCTTWRSGSAATTSAIWSQTGQRRTVPAPRYTRCAARTRSAPHDWHVCGATVMSAPKSSYRRPPSALPSSHRASSLISSSGRSESLEADRGDVVAQADHQVGGSLDKGRRPADEDPWPSRRFRADVAEHLRVDPAREAGPAGGRLARERLMHGEPAAGAEACPLGAL